MFIKKYDIGKKSTNGLIVKNKEHASNYCRQIRNCDISTFESMRIDVPSILMCQDYQFPAS